MQSRIYTLVPAGFSAEFALNISSFQQQAAVITPKSSTKTEITVYNLVPAIYCT